MHKLDALTRILEVETFRRHPDVRPHQDATTELAEKLEARGYAAAAMNGDMAQAQREQTVERLKKGSLDILVATDVAARGLDVDRISHVVNYDIPYDTEAYIHRIGRTGRAGRRAKPFCLSRRASGACCSDRASDAAKDRRAESADDRDGQQQAHRRLQAEDHRHAGRRRNDVHAEPR